MRYLKLVLVALAFVSIACKCSFDLGGDDRPSSRSPAYYTPEPPNPAKQFQNNVLITPAVVMIISAFYMLRIMGMYADKPKNGEYVFMQFMLPIASILLCVYQPFFPGLAPTGSLTFLPSFIGGAVMMLIFFVSRM